jgi:hypothetical protein
MTLPRVERRLTAILAAGIVGFLRLMGADEEGSLARLKEVRSKCRFWQSSENFVQKTASI